MSFHARKAALTNCKLFLKLAEQAMAEEVSQRAEALEATSEAAAKWWSQDTETDSTSPSAPVIDSSFGSVGNHLFGGYTWRIGSDSNEWTGNNVEEQPVDVFRVADWYKLMAKRKVVRRGFEGKSLDKLEDYENATAYLKQLVERRLKEIEDKQKKAVARVFRDARDPQYRRKVTERCLARKSPLSNSTESAL